MKIMDGKCPGVDLCLDPVRDNEEKCPAQCLGVGAGGWALLELTDVLHVYIMTLNFSGRAYYQASVVM